jgi:hypothetical protein
LFPEAISYRGGYRVTSAMLGRDLEEDLGLMPDGIKDFGLADQPGEEREGKRSAIDIVMEYGHKSMDEATDWLRRMLGGDSMIIMQDGSLMTIMDQAETALLNSGQLIFQRGGELVSIVKGRSRPDSISRSSEATTIFPINPDWMIQLMMRACKWGKITAKGKVKQADVTLKYANAMLNRPPNEWKFPVLRGVINAPTLTRNGDIIESAGYDPKSQLLLNFADGDYASIPVKPTKKQAKTALDKFNHIMRGFPFEDEASRSVALSAMLTALVRPSLRTSPLHGFDAPTAGTGKSILAEAPSILVCGVKSPSMSQGKTTEEDEKKLSTVLHAGDPVILIDNCQQQVTGDFLCMILSQEVVQARILGLSERRILPSTALVVCNGNNLTFAGDVTRRSVRCSLDAKLERPDKRRFDFDFHDELISRRAELVVAGLTVLRAYIVAGRPVDLEPMGSFNDWSWIRGALVWLGHADPVLTRENILESDPKRSELSDVLVLWHKIFGTRAVTLAEVGQTSGMETEKTSLRTLLTEVSGRQFWSTKSVGWWMRRNSKRIVGGKYFIQSSSWGNVSHWRLKLENQKDSSGEEDNVVDF